MAEELCPTCGSPMEIVKMEEEDILRCASCGYERPLIAVEPWDPQVDGTLVKYTVVAGIIAMVVLWAIIYTTVLVHYRGG